MNGNERYILEGIIIVLIAAYIFYENVFMAVILSPYVYIHYRQRIKERIVHDKKNFKKKFKDGIIAVSFALNVGYSIGGEWKCIIGRTRRKAGTAKREASMWPPVFIFM